MIRTKYSSNFVYYAFLLILTLLIIQADAHAQNRTKAQQADKLQITGRLTDSLGAGIDRATIRVFGGTDSVHTLSGADGRFSCYVAWVPDSLLRIRVEHLSHHPLARAFKRDPEVFGAHDLGQLQMRSRSIGLETVQVEKRPEVYTRGDTIFFETDHIRTAEGAYTEELIRRISGMQVDGAGNVSYLGQRITHVRLNGVDFFGGDVALALQNLPRDLILRLQLIQDHGIDYELLGIRSVNPVLVLNLEVEEDKTRGRFGNGKGGYGTEERYALNGSGHAFNKDRQAALFLGKNNLEAPRNYSASNESNSGHFASQPNDLGGIITSTGVSASYSDKFPNQMAHYLYYAFNKLHHDRRSSSVSSQTYGASNAIVSSRDHQDLTRTITHDIGQSGMQNFLAWRSKNRATSIQINPIIQFEQTTGTRTEADVQQYLQQGKISTTQSSGSQTHLDQLNRQLGLNASASKRLPNQHSLSLSLLLRYRDDDLRNRKMTEISQVDVASSARIDSTVQHQTDRQHRSLSVGLTGRYSLAAGDHSRLTFITQLRQNNQRENRDVRDMLQVQAPIDSLGSEVNIDLQHAELTAQFDGRLSPKASFTVSANAYYLRQVHEDRSLSDRRLQRATLYVTPGLNLSLSGARLRKNFSYSYMVSQPDIHSLNPIPEYRTPQYIVFGDPQLKSGLIHNFSAYLAGVNQSSNPLMGHNYRITGIYHVNRIVQDLYIRTMDGGLIRQEVYFRNLSGDLKVTFETRRGLFAWDFQDDQSLTLDGNAVASSGRERYYEAGTIGESFLSSGRVNLALRYQSPRNFNSLDFSYDVQHNSVSNTFGVSTIQTLSARVSIAQHVARNLKLSGNLQKAFNWGYRGPANRNPFGIDLFLNGGLVRSHLSWELAAKDLLNERGNQGRTVSRNEVIDYYNNNVGRHIVASIVWKMGRFGTKIKGQP